MGILILPFAYYVWNMWCFFFVDLKIRLILCLFLMSDDAEELEENKQNSILSYSSNFTGYASSLDLIVSMSIPSILHFPGHALAI